MGISHSTFRLATFSSTTHIQRTQLGKDKTDPASYRGIYLNDTLAKLFEGLLISRLTTHTELLNTLTHNQLGTKPNTQTHDAIYSLFAIVQHNKYPLEKPTYVAFIDYSTAYPSVHRDGLSSTLLKNDIRGNMWIWALFGSGPFWGRGPFGVGALWLYKPFGVGALLSCQRRPKPIGSSFHTCYITDQCTISSRLHHPVWLGFSIFKKPSWSRGIVTKAC